MTPYNGGHWIVVSGFDQKAGTGSNPLNIVANFVSGLILLVAMIGAIVLTLRQREGVKKQSILRQNARTRAESVEVKQVPSRSGV